MPPIKFKSGDDYERQCEQLIESGITEAAERIWQCVSAEMSTYWERERLYHMDFADDEYMHRSCDYLTHSQLGRLSAYKRALEALGCRLDVVTHSIGYIRIHEVSLSQDRGGLGCVRSWPRDEWL